MPTKSGKKANKRATGSTPAKPAKPRKESVRRVQDPLVRKGGEPAPNTSAFKPPPKPPKRFEELDIAARRKIVAKLIPKPEPTPPERVLRSLRSLEPTVKRFHGAKLPIRWFPPWLLNSPCADKFGYMFSSSVRNASKLTFNTSNQQLLDALGNVMGDVGRESAGDSIIPAGYTYFGPFVDHDVTFDTTSTIDTPQDANRITNMRTPALDLDSVYGRGPAMDPYLYRFPSPGSSPTAVKMQIGRNRNVGTGGPRNGSNVAVVPTTFDVPRILSGTDTIVTTPESTFTAVIGDPRNDENVLVSQFHHAMLRFHNRVVDMLVSTGFAGDIFTEAKKIVTHHYQWCVLHDFLPRVCGASAVNAAIGSVAAPVGSPFRMPVEFAVAAYRFGHSMIRNGYILNTSLPPSVSTLKGVFDFIRVPLLPLFSNWVVDFNMFFNTAHAPAGFNNARKIDSVLANGLEQIPGGSGIMAILASRNLRRGLAFGLPSGQAAASAFGITPLTAAQLTSGLPVNEVNLLGSNSGLLINKTPLWYYVLREAMVLNNGDQLGPLGARIVAETFVRMLKRDGESILRVSGFAPALPSSVAGQFTIADMLEFAGVLVQ